MLTKHKIIKAQEAEEVKRSADRDDELDLKVSKERKSWEDKREKERPSERKYHHKPRLDNWLEILTDWKSLVDCDIMPIGEYIKIGN